MPRALQRLPSVRSRTHDSSSLQLSRCYPRNMPGILTWGRRAGKAQISFWALNLAFVEARLHAKEGAHEPAQASQS